MDDEIKSVKEDNHKDKTLNRNRSSLEDFYKIRKYGLRPLSRNKLSKSTKNFSVSSKFLKSSSMFNRTLASSVRGWGMSDLHSANSLQNSVYSWSFGKANRFGNFNRAKSTDMFYNLPKIKSDKVPSFGIGDRSELVVPNGKDSPPPNTYKILTSVDMNKLKRKGPLIFGRIKEPDPTTIKFPGPGTYKVSNEFWRDKHAFQLKSRIMYFYDEDIAKQKHCISPQKYLPATKIQQNLRFNKITFGVGERSKNELTYMIKNPGPGTYKPPSVFDKGRRFKTPLN